MNAPRRFGLRATCAIFLQAVAGALGLWQGSARAQEPEFQPYVIDHLARANTPFDITFIADRKPAGESGFIRVKDGHLASGDGARFRIWGVNMTGWTRGSANLPPKDQAEGWATALERLGVNCVRLHFLDLPTRNPATSAALETEWRKEEDSGQRSKRRPVGLIDGTRGDNQAFDPEAVDRLDWFVYQLKRRGIYANLNLNVGMRYTPADGVPDADVIQLSKGFVYIGARMIELQKQYARMLLTHRNPYTQTEYRYEPAVATVEIINENSILEFWMRNWLRGELTKDGPRNQLDFTPFYARELDRLYQEWLDRHCTPREVAHLRELAGVKPGDPVPRLRRGDFSTAPKERFYAEADFLSDIERGFFAQMRTYLKTDLNVQSLVVGNADHTYWIPGQPMLRANSLLDYVDGHVYWQHPAVSGRRDMPMVDDPLHATVVRLSRTPLLGRPYTVSEVNHPNPNEYGAEMIPILAAYAAFQDWDGVYFYTFEPKVGPDYQHYVADEFDLTLDPVKMTQMPVGALLFARADAQPAREVVSRSYSNDQVNEMMRMPEADRPYFTPGLPLSIALRHGLRTSSLDGPPTGILPPEVSPPYVSDTGELGWHLDPGHRGLVTIDTPRSQALVGFIRDNPSLTTKHLSAELKNDFAAVTLTSLTEEPIQRANRLLLTACARWQNTGATWNDRHTLWTNMGHAPTEIEPVKGWLVLRELDGAVAVKATPLDGSEKPLGEALSGRRLEEGWEIPLGTVPTTHYLVEVVR